MKTRLIWIGNSKAIRIPQLLLDKAGLEDELDVSAEANRLVIRSAKKPREDWAQAFAEMAKHNDHILLDDAQSLSHWDDQDWQW